MLTSSEIIDQAIVYGDNKPYLVALVVVNKEYNNNIESLEKEIEIINKNLTKLKKLKNFF